MLISRCLVQSMLPNDAGASLSDAQWGEALTSLGLEVEGMTVHGTGLDAVVVGRVESVEPHPQADKLRLVQLFDGQRTVAVVCGAPNVPPPGGRVAFAPVGTTLPDGLEIGARSIRGVHSEGMICSEVELAIGHDHDGILILPEAWSPGTRLVDAVPGIVDTVYELSVTPNRPDALGHVGVAADLAVKFGTRLAAAPEIPGGVGNPLSAVPELPELVTLEAPERCGRYIGRAFEGATVGTSPLWLRVRLHRLGLRAINQVVDVTNYVLMEWGQPLHVFDRNALDGGRVVVRRARAGEPMTTLDEQELQLGPDDLVIADAAKPAALAGVMGGMNSGVEPGATDLVLEAAWFDPAFVRRTARAHGLQTDSSYRFERGVDHGARLTAAAARACTLIESLSGARCIGGVDVRGQTPAIPTILVRPERSRMLLGMTIEPAEAERILTGLEISVDRADTERWVCVPPSHRPDLEREVDLIEELMRHHGLDALPAVPTVPSMVDFEVSADVVEREREGARDDRLIRGLTEAGLHEHISMVFSSADALEPFADEIPLDRAVEVANPMRVQTSLMRTHMAPGLLDALATNVARHANPVRLFEFGRIYGWPQERVATDPDSPTAEVDARLPQERQRAAILLSDGAHPEQRRLDGRTLAGVVLRVLARAGVAARVLPCDPDAPSPASPGAPRHRRAAWLHPGVQAVVGDGVGGVFGRLGQVHPDLMQRWRLPETVTAYYAEVWVEHLPPWKVARYVPLPRFPATSRDLSLEIPIGFPAARVVDALTAAGRSKMAAGDDPPTLAGGDRGQGAVEVLEDYRGKSVPPGQRALLLRLHYRAQGRSVTDSEVQELHASIVEAACERLRPQVPTLRTR